MSDKIKLTGEHFINGVWRAGDNREFASGNPVTDETVWSGTEASEETVKDAVRSAQAAFPSWSALSFDDRLALVERCAALAKEHAEELANLISRETGKALWDARTEAGAVAAKAAVSLKAYNERTPTFERELGATSLRVSHLPHGVAAVLGPFNFPAHLPNGHIVPALLAGNTIIFKPSEQSPAVGEFMVRLWEQAGLPPGVLNLVQGGRSPAETLVGDDGVNAIFFTGGVNAGTAIHRTLAGRPDKMLALELGGNNPLVVWDAKDASAAARIIVKSAFLSAGQRCTCTRRLILPSGAAGDQIVDATVQLAKQLKLGVPDADPQPFMGAMISRSAVQDVLDAQKDFEDKGGIALLAAERSSLGDAFVTPGLMDVTAIENRPDREIFGPFLQVIRADDFEAAIEEANNTRFGLAAGLISDHRDLFDRFASAVRAGVLNWNRQTTGASGQAPFGGPGLSGNLRPAGYYAADYCAWPMASMLAPGAAADDEILPGMPD